MKSASLISLLLILILCGGACAEEDFAFSLAEMPSAGASAIAICPEDTGLTDYQVNIFSGEEPLGRNADMTDDSQGSSRITAYLTRPLREGEEIRVYLAASGADGNAVQTSKSYTVLGRFGSKLQRLRTRADSMWPVWNDAWGRAFQEGTVDARVRFDDLPFAAFPDEAPEIFVEESDGTARVWLEEPLPEEWILSFATGIPAELEACVLDAEKGAYVGKAGFDRVYLTSSAGAWPVSITIAYERSEQFLPSWPVIEWVEDGTEGPVAFNCYGFGTARHFDGGMFAVVKPGAAWYMEYGADHALASMNDLMTECLYSPEGELISGEQREEFAFPFVLW